MEHIEALFTAILLVATIWGAAYILGHEVRLGLAEKPYVVVVDNGVVKQHLITERK